MVVPNGDDQMKDPVPLGRTGLGWDQLAPSPDEVSACDYVPQYVVPV